MDVKKHRAIIVGAGRVGASFKFMDDGYSHAGAYVALKDRVELVGFVEPDEERATAAWKKWGVPNLWIKGEPVDSVCCAIGEWKPDIVSVCTNPDQERGAIMYALEENKHIVKGVWCEKWYVPPRARFRGMPPITSMTIPVQVNYQRRGDPRHQEIAFSPANKKLVVYGKDDETTRCHFRDLSRWWKIPLDYRPYNGPCAYILEDKLNHATWFDGGNGGVDSAAAFKNMLGNLLDHVDRGTPLWSPPYVE